MRYGLRLAVVGLACWTAACVRATGPAVELRFAFRGELPEIETITRTVKLFEQAHPGLRVRVECPPYYRDNILAQFSQDAAPDVIFAEIHDVDAFERKGVLLDLNPRLARDQDFKLSGYDPGAIARFSAGGRCYVVPRDMAPFCCVFYNRELFAAAGLPLPRDDWQWPRDFLPAAQRLTQRDAAGKILRYGFVDDWPMWDVFVLSNGGTYVDAAGRPALDSPASLEAVQFRRDLALKYRVMPAPGEWVPATWAGAAELFASGRTAMFLSGYWRTPYLRESARFDWDIVLFPRGPAGPRRFSSGGSGYGISSRSRHAGEAWELVKFLAGRPGQVELARAGLAQPSLTAVAASAVFLDGLRPANKRALLGAAANVLYEPTSETWQRFLSGYLYPGLDQIWKGEAPVAITLRRIVARGREDLYPRR